VPIRRSWCEHTVVGDELLARTRHECSEALEESQRGASVERPRRQLAGGTLNRSGRIGASGVLFAPDGSLRNDVLTRLLGQRDHRAIRLFE
jgi:hypothetical protein